MNYAVILAGGSGKRFWPLSRKSKPKQFLSIISKKTMIEETVDRVASFTDRKNIIVVASIEQKDNFDEVDLNIPDENILYEPVAKNTAMAIAYAAAFINKIDKDAIMIVLPSDHYIKEKDLFKKSVTDVIKSANEGYLVTFGITPNRPEMGYGYINIGEAIDNKGELYKVSSFVEKPNQRDAIDYMKKGTFLWNSGMFIWRADVIKEEFRKYLPEHYESMVSIEKNRDDVDIAYKKIENISIDYGIMERSSKIACKKCNFTWDDVGSWKAIERHNEKDGNGNTIIGNAELKDAHDNIIISKEGLTVLIGVDDIIVVRTNDATLVCQKDKDNEIKEIIDKIGNQPNKKQYI
jgi:mannose-1-phosphate guanylyltransferase